MLLVKLLQLLSSNAPIRSEIFPPGQLPDKERRGLTIFIPLD